jgi:hypothetical protein
MKWLGVNLNDVETTFTRGMARFTGLKFQIPRGLCQYGLSEYKSINIEIGNKAFIKWWREMETKLCAAEPFNSNLKGSSLRIKVEDGTPVFDAQRNYVGSFTTAGEGAGKEMSCLIEITGVYFFNNQYGFTVKCNQIMVYDDIQAVTEAEEEPIVPIVERALLDDDE